MADEATKAETADRRGLTLPTARATAFALFAFMLILGVAFYLWWGITYNGWVDNGVYAVTVTLVMLGIGGMLVSAPHPPAASA